VTLRVSDQARMRERLASQGHVIRALDGLQPDVGHEVFWVLRDCHPARSSSGSEPSESQVRLILLCFFAKCSNHSLCPFTVSSQMGNTLSAMQFVRLYPTSPTNCATSIPCVKRPNRCTKRTAMPKRHSKSGFVESVRLNERWTTVWTRRQRLSVGTVWRYEAPEQMTGDRH
jgi:hypothetical protein